MKAAASIFQELAGLFVDDGSLALAILAVVAIAGLFLALLRETPLVAGAILLFGCHNLSQATHSHRAC